MVPGMTGASQYTFFFTVVCPAMSLKVQGSKNIHQFSSPISLNIRICMGPHLSL